MLWQAMEKDLFEAQHGAARTAAEAAGPVHLHARPPPAPAVRPARVSYPGLLTRFQQDVAAQRMSTFREPADTDSEPEDPAEADGLAADAAPGGHTHHSECWVCRSVEHSTQRCPVMWLAGYPEAKLDSSPARAEHDASERQQTEGCSWLAHVPDSLKDMMDAMQQYATDAAHQLAFSSGSPSVRG